MQWVMVFHFCVCVPEMVSIVCLSLRPTTYLLAKEEPVATVVQLANA